VFEEEKALDQFETFASLNGPAFYGLPPNEEKIRLRRAPSTIPERVNVGKAGDIRPLFGGETVEWSVA
jgi:dihydroorotase